MTTRVIGFLPLFLMSGIIGRLFREFALFVTASIAVSVLVSLTLAPIMRSRSGIHSRSVRSRPHYRLRRAGRAGAHNSIHEPSYLTGIGTVQALFTVPSQNRLYGKLHQAFFKEFHRKRAS